MQSVITFHFMYMYTDLEQVYYKHDVRKLQIRYFFSIKAYWYFFLFLHENIVCLCWGLRPIQPNVFLSSAVSLLKPHFYWAGLVLEAVNQYCKHSFPRNWQLSFLNQRKEENDHRTYFMINLHKRMSNLQLPDHQSDAHPTEPPR